jgi:hypothetical protein
MRCGTAVSFYSIFVDVAFAALHTHTHTQARCCVNRSFQAELLLLLLSVVISNLLHVIQLLRNAWRAKRLPPATPDINELLQKLRPSCMMLNKCCIFCVMLEI